MANHDGRNGGFRWQQGRRLGAALLAVTAAGVLPGRASAAPGQTDPGFGGGVVELPEFELGVLLAVQPDGRVVVVGRPAGRESFVAIRLGADGRRDPSYAGGQSKVGGVGWPDAAGSDGAGRTLILLQEPPRVIRLLADGAVDATWGATGTAPVPGLSRATAMTVHTDGRVVVAGQDADSTGVVRLTVAGRPDATFGAAGLAAMPAGAVAHGLVVDGPGRLVAVGGLPPFDCGPRFPCGPAVATRQLPDGRPDPSFGGGDGVAETPSRFVGLAVDGAGRIVLGDTGGMMRLLADGAVDRSFAEAPGTLSGGRPIILPDGSVLVGFQRRVFPDGRPDPSYGRCGIAVAPGFFDGGDEVLRPDGVVLVSGWTGPPNARRAAVAAFQTRAGGPAHPTAKGTDGVLLATAAGELVSLYPACAAGSLAGTRLNRPVVGLASTPTGAGYWMVASDGGVFSFGDARFLGSTGAIRLNRPVVAMASTPSGRGYWLVASDGGVFAFGDARYFGSTGAVRLNSPVVGMAATPSGGGYWLVASDGGIFSFGDARYFGSTGAVRLDRPVVAMAATPSGRGYWMLASDGGVFNFGDARFLGQSNRTSAGRYVALLPTVSGAGYGLVVFEGLVGVYGDASFRSASVFDFEVDRKKVVAAASQ